MSAVIGMMMSLAVLLLFSGVQRIRAPGIREQIAQYGEAQRASAPQSRYERWVRPLALRLAGGFTMLRGLTDPQQTARQLVYAGSPRGIGEHEFYGVQVYGGLAGLVAGVVWLYGGLPLGPFALILLPIGGFCWPLLWLRVQVKRRQQAISVALPDLLDMLAVCVSAGMGFDIALTLLAERGEGPLYEELDRLLRELRIGEPREQAFRHLSQRNSSEALRSFVDALLQAEELGSPIAATLERQAEDLRIYRRHRAREQGAKAATKISLVVVVAVMPSVLCVILGALALAVSSNAGPLLPK
ncbi:MAG TPA: type II secretion system F family protein [Roseiflexaceae bacterium]|nr:type II secretion system F family protein [Roseiflexaceae bacterium]